jgi:hypothetical protein
VVEVVDFVIHKTFLLMVKLEDQVVDQELIIAVVLLVQLEILLPLVPLKEILEVMANLQPLMEDLLAVEVEH